MKTCVIDGCDNLVFTHGYCRRHSHNYYSLKEVKPKAKPKVKYKTTGERALFDAIWSMREHTSYLTGKKLDCYSETFYLNMFAHVLPKGKYPDFRLFDKNIVLLTPEEHYLLDFGTEEQRQRYSDRWYLIDDLKEVLLAEYTERRRFEEFSSNN